MIKKQKKSVGKDEQAFTHCPSCGKKVPNKGSCNKCGASLSLTDRLTIKKLHVYILILGIIGAGLMGYAYYEATYITPIGDINPNMEGQVIRMSGTIVDVEFDSRYDKTSFRLNDSTGSIDFYGWSDFTSDLREAGILPGIGDEVIVEGTVDIYNSSYSGLITSIVVNKVDAIELLPSSAKKMDIKEILLNDVGKVVKIEGEVKSRYLTPLDYPYDRYMSFTVEGNGENITVYVNAGQIGLAGDKLVYPEIGDQVEILGLIEEYDNELEILPTTATERGINIIEV